MAKPYQQLQLTCATTFTLVAKGNESAFAALYDRTSVYVFSLALSIAKERAHAEQITKNLYLDLWKGNIAYESSYGTQLEWLLLLTRRKALDQLRLNFIKSRARTSLYIRPLQEGADIKQPQVARRTKEAGSDSSEQWALISAAFFQDMSRLEMTSWPGLSEATVHRRLSLGFQQLRTAIRARACEV